MHSLILPAQVESVAPSLPPVAISRLLNRLLEQKVSSHAVPRAAHSTCPTLRSLIGLLSLLGVKLKFATLFLQAPCFLHDHISLVEHVSGLLQHGLLLTQVDLSGP